MSLKIMIAATVALFGVSGAALASDVVSATLETPLAAKEQVVAASLVWTCEASTCVAASRATPSVRTCRALAREVGRITAFGTEVKLDTADVEACNARARVRTAAN